MKRVEQMNQLRIAMPIIAGILLLGSVICAVNTALFLATAETTTGTITKSDTATSDSGNTLYQPTFVFAVSGNIYTVTPWTHVAPSPGNAGDRVRVLYDPGQPENARIDAFIYTWATPLALLFFAIIFGLIHFAIADITRRFNVIASKIRSFWPQKSDNKSINTKPRTGRLDN